MREPKWLRAAYTLPPTLLRSDGSHLATATAAIECWRGSVEELASPIDVLLNSGPDQASLECQITWADGSQEQAYALASLSQVLVSKDLEDALVVRAEVSSHRESMTSVLVARKKLPGLTLTVTGPDSAKVLGVAELAFHRMMIGYVDRMGGYRGLAWMLVALAPILLASLVVEEGPNAPIRLGLLLLAAASGLATFHYSYPRLLVSEPLKLMDSTPLRRRERWKVAILAVYRHRYSRPVLGAFGALALGVIGNKLSDVIPFP